MLGGHILHLMKPGWMFAKYETYDFSVLDLGSFQSQYGHYYLFEVDSSLKQALIATGHHVNL